MTNIVLSVLMNPNTTVTGASRDGKKIDGYSVKTAACSLYTRSTSSGQSAAIGGRDYGGLETGKSLTDWRIDQIMLHASSDARSKAEKHVVSELSSAYICMDARLTCKISKCATLAIFA